MNSLDNGKLLYNADYSNVTAFTKNNQCTTKKELLFKCRYTINIRIYIIKKNIKK